MLHNPLQHTRMGQTRHHDEEHADDHYRRGAEARESLFGIQHTRNEEDGDSTKKH